MKRILTFVISFVFTFTTNAQDWSEQIDGKFYEVLQSHREFVSIPNLPTDVQKMYQNIAWVKRHYKEVGFTLKNLESSTLPVLFAERVVNPDYKTVLIYFHLDGQPVDPKAWDQEDPFIPVLKDPIGNGEFREISWDELDYHMDDNYRIFARAAADDKAPIVMLLSALEIMKANKLEPKFNIKIIFDLEEEYGSNGFLSTLKKYKEIYSADYMIIMDGPAHNSNQPTLTFGCRGIATCSLTTFGAKLPQHSGHYGNYAPNAVFGLSRILASMKDEDGNVLIDDYYKEVNLSDEVRAMLSSVPENKEAINKALFIKEEEKVGMNYQEALQYPTLNIRQIETSWKGEGLKTVIPEYATAHIDVRLVAETDRITQLDKIDRHLKKLGYLVLDRDPTDAERLSNKKIVKFKRSKGVNAFRTELDSPFGEKLRNALTKEFGKNPISIRTMGGTVPIIPAINELKIPAVIVPMVNMDNNQHSPNENIRIGNIRQGIRICLSLLNTRI